MTSATTAHLSIPESALRPVLPGLFLAALTLLFGFGMGIVFGYNEDAIKGRLSASAAAAPAATYADDAASKAVLDKSWTYMQRAHLHAGGLGATAVALTLVMVLLGTGAAVARALSLALGAGGLGYSIFWMMAGFRAPGLGSTGAAKETLNWLAMPSAGLYVVATLAVAVLLLRALISPRRSA